MAEAQMWYRECSGYVARCACGWTKHHTNIDKAREDGTRHTAEWHGPKGKLFEHLADQ